MRSSLSGRCKPDRALSAETWYFEEINWMGKKIHADTVADFLSLQETLEMAGLEYMTAILDGAHMSSCQNHCAPFQEGRYLPIDA